MERVGVASKVFLRALLVSPAVYSSSSAVREQLLKVKGESKQSRSFPLPSLFRHLLVSVKAQHDTRKHSSPPQTSPQPSPSPLSLPSLPHLPRPLLRNHHLAMPRTLPPKVQLMIFRLAAPTVEFSPLLVAQKEVAAGRTFLSNLFLVHRNWTAWAQGQLSSFLSLWVGPQSRFVSLRGHFAWMKERGHRVQMLWLREEPWYRLNGAGYLRNELVDILEDVEEVVVRCGGGQLDFIHSMPSALLPNFLPRI